jgi:hypothetical protein
MVRFWSKIRYRQRSVGLLGSIFLLVIKSASASDRNLSPDSANRAKNLARMNCGAQIDYITADGRVTPISAASTRGINAGALIMDDSTISHPLPEGESNFVITLPKTALLDRFTFVNENAAARGEVRVSVSNYRLPANSPKWTQVERIIQFSHKRLVDVSLPGVEAKFVKLSFRVEKAGHIAALGLYGEESLEKFATRQGRVTRIHNSNRSPRFEDIVNFNFANLYARARVVYVSSGSTTMTQRMIDDDTATSFHFSPADPHPTVIVELAERERLHRVSALYKMQSGRLDIYVMDELPKDPNHLRYLAPTASVTDPGNGKAAVDVDPRGARYVALRWTPDHSQAVKDAFEIAEVCAFGGVPLSTLFTNEAANFFASNPPLQLGPVSDPPVIVPVSP